MIEPTPKHFIEHIIDEDLKSGLDQSLLRFRFPPEPNGYLHIGHVKAIFLNFELAKKYEAPVNLRFDDTNPAKEEQHFVDAIKNDIVWLGYMWDKELYASDYFDQLYLWATQLIKKGLAYVDSQTPEQIADQKGTPTSSGKKSPFRNQATEEALRLFKEMKQGKHPEGAYVLRFKGDMSSTNMLLRDPILYRIIHKHHHRTKNEWFIYPMYDWAHGQSDYLEQVSHSLCTLEFKPHRDLYNGFLDHLADKGLRPKQREFARLNLDYTITSKRKLQRLVKELKVTGWDDPRMPTISGLRRRGYTASALRQFANSVGVAKRENTIDASLLEFCVRNDLNCTATRVMVVLNPVKVIITNYNEPACEMLQTINNPEDPASGTRELPFSKTLYIEQEDFNEAPNPKYHRLIIGGEVRLKSAYFIKAESFQKDKNGNIQTIYCKYDPKSLSGSGTPESLRKAKATIHWVSESHAIKIEVRQYDRLFNIPNPEESKEVDFITHLNPKSLKVSKAFAEPILSLAKPGDRFQFQRTGYFVCDPDSTKKTKVFNKTVGLRDTWAKHKTPTHHKTPTSAINELRKLSKKFVLVSPEKQKELTAQIAKLSVNIKPAEIAELFGTSTKKTGTRIAVAVVLAEHQRQGVNIAPDAIDFIKKAREDKNPLLIKYAGKVEI